MKKYFSSILSHFLSPGLLYLSTMITHLNYGDGEGGALYKLFVGIGGGSSILCKCCIGVFGIATSAMTIWVRTKAKEL